MLGLWVEYELYGWVLFQSLTPLFVIAMIYIALKVEQNMRIDEGKPIFSWLTETTALKATPLLLWYALPGVNLSLIRIFKCTDFPDGTTWLNADLTLQCTTLSGANTVPYGLMVAYAWLMIIFVYGGGIPLLFKVLLERHDQEIRAFDKNADEVVTPEVLKPYQFLYSNYKIENYNREWCESFRRMTLMGFVAIFPLGSDCAMVGLLLSIFFVM